ncbi:DNA polymerase I [Anoxybacillus sp. BCO1]|nr:DNA polymerase I [Anoxybacillus sp. BCO1]
MERYTPEHVLEKYGLTPAQIVDLKGLMGDASDNIQVFRESEKRQH